MADEIIKPPTQGYPLDIRLRARELWLGGATFADVARELDIENPVTVSRWAVKGQWQQLRRELLAFAEKEQIKKLKKQLAEQLSRSASNLALLETFLLGSFFEKNNNGEVVLKNPDKFSVKDPASAAYAMLNLINTRNGMVKLTAELMGNQANRVSAEDVEFNQPVPPVGDPPALPPPTPVPAGPVPDNIIAFEKKKKGDGDDKSK